MLIELGFNDEARKQLYVRTGTSLPAINHQYNLSQHPYGVHLTGSQHVVVRGFTVRTLVLHSCGSLMDRKVVILLENKLPNGPVVCS